MLQNYRFSHLLFAGILLFLSILITKAMIQHGRIMDIPNQRSSHHRPTPKSGGIAIVVAFIIGIMGCYFLGDREAVQQDYMISFIIASILVALVSFYDDITNQPFIIKLVAQCVAVIAVLIFGIVIEDAYIPFFGEYHLGLFGYFISFVWIVGLTNAVNFMDGLDGLMGGVSIIACGFLSIITYTQGSSFMFIVYYSILAGCLGFFIFNFPSARIFMGDVGSAFLGFSFASLAIIAARYDHSHTPLLIVALLLFNIIFDSAFTFIRRFLHKEKVVEAHRTHLYQLLAQLGYSHWQVSSFYFVLSLLQGLAALWMISLPIDAQIYVFIPFLIFMFIYARLVLAAAYAKGILVLPA